MLDLIFVAIGDVDRVSCATLRRRSPLAGAIFIWKLTANIIHFIARTTITSPCFNIKLSAQRAAIALKINISIKKNPITRTNHTIENLARLTWI